LSVFHPKDWLRIVELKKLQSEDAQLEAANVPVPGWLTAKIADLRADLAGS